jgi:anti-sigma regulatory factor (Ser/Thr protein kinase)
VLKDGATDSLDGRHEIFVYASPAEFVRLAAPFVREGLAVGDTVVAALPPAGLAVLSDALGSAADGVGFVDITTAGRNPARLIPFWRDVLDRSPERPVRGLSEQTYPDRTPAEYDEALLHEALTDIAFAKADHFRLRCLYDATAGVDPTSAAVDTFRTSLSGVPERAERWIFGLADLGEVRQWIDAQASSYGLSRDRIDDLTLALHEICKNSIRFGGAKGTLSVWIADGSLICDVADNGRIDDLLVGRVMPPLDGLGGRGVWLANQLCDLVQLRSGEGFNQVRLHTRLR